MLQINRNVKVLFVNEIINMIAMSKQFPVRKQSMQFFQRKDESLSICSVLFINIKLSHLMVGPTRIPTFVFCKMTLYYKESSLKLPLWDIKSGKVRCGLNDGLMP